MSRLFSLDNPFMQFLSNVCDLIILNVIFILSCIPLFTVGASLSAMYTVTLKMVRREEPYIVKGFFKAFVSNFKQSTIVWLLSVLCFLFFQYDYTIAASLESSPFRIVQILLLAVIFLFISAFLYVFPILSHFICTTKQAVRNAFLMCLGHFPYTLIMLAYLGLISFLLTYSTKTLGLIIGVSIICGFSVTAFLFSLFFHRIFQRYHPKEEDPEDSCS